MRLIRKDEVDIFVKESLDFILKANKEENIELCVVCYPTYDYEGEFGGFKFGFIEEELAETLINNGGDIAKVISSSIALNKEIEISQMKHKNTKFFKEDGTEIKDVFEDYFNNNEYEIKAVVPPYDDLEKVWYKKEIEHFLEKIEYIKKEIYKIR